MTDNQRPESGKSPFTSPLVWAFALVLAVGSAVGGYTIGFSDGETKTLEKHGLAESDSRLVEAHDDDASQRFVGLAQRKEGDPYAIGDVDAPVVISEFSDFECPFCSKYAVETEPTIVQKYVDKGLVRIEFYDFPSQGPKSLDGARAGRAAADQGKFFEFKDVLFKEAYDRGGHPDFTMDDYVAFAEKVGIEDIEKFRADAGSVKYDEAITESRRKGTQNGVSGTPAFVVGSTMIAGAQPLASFEEVIASELEKAGQ